MAGSRWRTTAMGRALVRTGAAFRAIPARLSTSMLRMPMRLLIATRSRFSEDTLEACVARGVRQVVILGAGLDTF